MKAAVVKGKRRIEVEEVPTPTVQPGTLLLKTKYCSICGSDLEHLAGALDIYEGTELHVGAILGHEWVAEVAAVGEGVKGWSVGDRAGVASTRRSCGLCYFCRRGLYHFCLGGLPARASLFEASNYGSKFGAMAEYFIRPPNLAQKVPDVLSDEEVALAEPLATGVASVFSAGLKLGDSAVVVGAGKIGLGAMMCAKAAGVAPVIVIDIRKNRLDKALEVGADAVLNAKEVDVISEVVKLTDAGPDAVLVCVREGKVLKQAVEMVRRGGAIVTTGVLTPEETDSAPWMLKELRLSSHMSGPIDVSLNLMAHKLVNVKPLITEIIPLEEVQRAFDSMYSGENVVALLKP